ncbi:MAG: hypothetical protein DRN08_03050 [Thermoplasmata archaeon]|nr:MAG: hypothetical protein DRN08_03050 [Thermoplasmata archaeon]
MREGFNIPPPEMQQQGQDMYYDNVYGYETAWIRYIMEFRLPKELEDMLIKYTTPLVDLAAKSNIRRVEIPMHLLQYDIIWKKYRTHMHKGRWDPKLYVYKDIIRHAFELNLNRSVDGWQGELLFTKRYDIIERRREKKQNLLSRLFGKKQQQQYEEYMEG